MTVPSQQDATMTGQIPGRTSTHIFLHFASGEEFRGSTYRLKNKFKCPVELQPRVAAALGRSTTVSGIRTVRDYDSHSALSAGA